MQDPVFAAIKPFKVPEGAPDFWFGATHAANRLTSGFQSRLRSFLKERTPKTVVFMCRGNEHAVMSTIQHPLPFDVRISGAPPSFRKGAEDIPPALLKAQIRQIADNNVLLFWNFLIRSCRDVYHGRIVMLPPPPPVACTNHIQTFPGRFGDLVAGYGVSPPALRAKVWQLYCAVLKEAADGANQPFINLPETIFADGCLAEAYWSEDPTHGNARYGGVILDHVLSRIDQTSMA